MDNPPALQSVDPSPPVRPAHDQNAPAPKQKHPWLKVVVVTTALLITVPLAIGVVMAIQFSGGVESILHNMKPTPDFKGAAITEKRKAAARSVWQAFKDLEAEVSLDSYITSIDDGCYEGHNNWKIKDGFAHRCAYRATKFYGFSGDFRARMVAFEEKILSQGWAYPFEEKPLLAIMAEYYDEFYGPDKPKLTHFPEGYLVSNLPVPGGYEKGNAFLDIEYAEKATTDLFDLDYTQKLQRGREPRLHTAHDLTGAYTIVRTIAADNQYIFAVSIQELYYED